MTATSASLRQEWEAFRTLRYPHGRPDSELGSCDFGDLIELDAFIAGYVSRVVEGEVLNGTDFLHLATASLRVRALLVELSGETGSYFTRLAEVSEAAEATLSSRRE